MLITCGAFTPEGEFLELTEFDRERLLIAWQEVVFALYLDEEKIELAFLNGIEKLNAYQVEALLKF